MAKVESDTGIKIMNTIQHLLECLGEEGAEIAQATAKCNRFGLDDRNVLNPTGPTNRERLVSELNDVVAVADMLADEGIIPSDWQSTQQQVAKRKKVSEFMDYARKVGALAADRSRTSIGESRRRE